MYVTQEMLDSWPLKGNCRVQKENNIEIGSNVQIGPSVWLESNVWLGSNVWVIKTPLVIQGSRDNCYWCGPSLLAIGCEQWSMKHWQEHYAKIGGSAGYTLDEILEYKKYIDIFAQDRCAIEQKGGKSCR